MKYECIRCGYSTSRIGDMRKHYNIRKEICPPIILDTEASMDNVKKTESDKIECDFCGKPYTTKSNMNRHKKKCKNLKQVDDLAAKVAELEAKLEMEKSKPQTVINNYIQVNVNGYRDTNFEHLTDKHYQRAVRRMIYSVPQMIEDVHFNKNAPENHNIYIGNIKNKYAMVYDGEKWCHQDKDKVIDQLINDQEYAIEEWLGEGDKFPKEMKKFNEYFEKKEGVQGDEIKDIIKEEVKLLLYNNRNLVKTR